MSIISCYSLHTELYLFDIEKYLIAHGLFNELDYFDKTNLKTIQSLVTNQNKFSTSISCSDIRFNNKINIDYHIKQEKNIIDRFLYIEEKLNKVL